VPECGDGEMNGDEACDADDVGNQSCLSLGFASGELSCADDCSEVLTDDCVAPVCGDGAQNGDEACEGNDLGNQDCEDAGFDDGELACTDECELDTSGCLICQQFTEDCSSDADCCPGMVCDAFFDNTCWP
jgi:hypothetical protein